MTRKSSYLPNHFRNFKEVSRKNVYYDNIKSYKKTGLYALSRKCGKATWGKTPSLFRVTVYHIFLFRFKREQYVSVNVELTFKKVFTKVRGHSLSTYATAWGWGSCSKWVQLRTREVWFVTPHVHIRTYTISFTFLAARLSYGA